MNNKSSQILGCGAAGEVVGFILAMSAGGNLEYGNHRLMDTIGVAPAYQKRGVARPSP